MQVAHDLVAANRDGSAAILALLAAAIALVAAAAWWVAAHPRVVQEAGRKLQSRPRLLQIQNRYRRQIEFLVQRFHPGGALGLSFTVALVVFVVSAWAFGSLLQDILGREDMALFDLPILRYTVAHRAGWLTAAMRAISVLGSGPFLLTAVGAAGLIFRRKTGSWQPLLLLVSAAAGAGLLDLVTSVAIARPRPPTEWTVIPASQWAVPVGYCAPSVTYGAVAYLLARVPRAWRTSIRIWAIAIAVMILIGASGVYLAVRWPTDVLAGWALAGGWLAIVATTGATLGDPRLRSPSQPAERRAPVESDTRTRVSLPQADSPRVGLDGLDDAEVEARIKRGQVNRYVERASRSLGQILRANILTRFTLLLGALAVIMLWVGPPQDALFAGVLLVNAIIGVGQELRAKRVLDRFSVLTSPTAHVVRDGKRRELRPEEIVLDDVLELRRGDQVSVDGVVLIASGLEVDESLLTGESDPVAKRSGDQVLSGSFVVAGNGRIRAMRIGEEAYARTLAAEARHFTLAHSELRAGINRILAYVTWLMVPTGGLLVVVQLLHAHQGWRDAVRGSVAGIVGMVPEGLVLLASMAFAMGAVRLARRRVLVQDLPAVELLARVDVLCSDKSGTLTDGRVRFDRVILPAEPHGPPGDRSEDDIRQVLGALAAAETGPNASLDAIAAACPRPSGADWRVIARIPFASDRKWSAATLAGHGTWVLGAPEVVLAYLDGPTTLLAEANRLAAAGHRVLALAHTLSPLTPARAEANLPPALTPSALVLLAERLRSDAEAALRYLTAQGVALKVISGDNPRTVAAVAVAAGVPGANPPVDGRELPDDPEEFAQAVERASVFGRVTPLQKGRIVTALQRRGHVVAMIGDGVNDVVSIKRADLGIAMGTGTAASRAVAQLVLLDDSFATFPLVIAEGRRVVANLERTAGLFLTKTVYVLAMALAIGVATAPFPLLPRHLTLISLLTIGTPAFVLALAPNGARARAGFISRVLRFAVPTGCTVAAATIGAYAVARYLDPTHLDLARTVTTLTVIACGLSVLAFLTYGSDRRQRLLSPMMVTLLGIILVVPPLRTLFALELPALSGWLVIVAFAGSTYAMLGLLRGVWRHPAQVCRPSETPATRE